MTSDVTSRPVAGALRDAAHGPLPALLLGLTFLTGVVDAASILGLDRVFVANMTGNVVFLAFAAAGAPGFSLVGSLAALAGFLVGALLVLNVSLAAGLGVATLVLAAVTAGALVAVRRPAAWRA